MVINTKVITISNNKGGAGKTTATANLAGLMAKNTNFKVLLIDLDGQANLSLSFGVPSSDFKYHVHDALIKDINVADAIYNIYPNIDIMPSSADMDNFDFEVLLNTQRYTDYFKLLNDVIINVKANFDYDFILIDCPPSLGLATLNALSSSDYVLIPTQLETYSMNSINSILNAIFGMQTNQNPNLKILGVFPSVVKMNTNVARQVLFTLKSYLESLDIKLFDTFIPESSATPSSVAFNEIPIVLNPKSAFRHNNVTAAFNELYTEILHEIDKDERNAK